MDGKLCERNFLSFSFFQWVGEDFMIKGCVG